MTKREHNEYCKHIVDELEKYASGEYFLHDGELYPLDSDDEFWSGDECYYCLEDDGYYYYHIGGEQIEETEVEPASLWDYICNAEFYNTDYVLDSNKELQAVRLMITCGAPNVYINTWDKRVELFWWSESGEAYLPAEICEWITDVIRELECF